MFTLIQQHILPPENKTSCVFVFGVVVVAMRRECIMLYMVHIMYLRRMRGVSVAWHGMDGVVCIL